MRSFSLADLRDSLVDLGISPGDVVLMHASLLTLGTLTGHTANGVPAAVIQCLLEYLGSDGVLATPAFNFDFCRGIRFDRDRTPCPSMGVLAETVRTWPGASRSRHPTQSVAAIGAAAGRICDDSGEYAFASGSAFGKLLEHNARVLLLGVNFQAASLIHYAEEQVGVPYRYWKAFRGEYVEGGQQRQHTCWMYVRDLTLDPQLDMKPVELELIARGALKSRSLGRGIVRACDARDLVAAAEAVLRRDCRALVSPGRVPVSISG